MHFNRALNTHLWDCHVHTPLCGHATGEPADYVEAARRAGLAGIGFADHNPMPEEFDEWRMLLGDLPRYFEMIEETRASFPSFPVLLGLECDFIEGREAWVEKLAGMADWDYLIGSVHYIPEGWEVDNPKFIDKHRGAPMHEMWAAYWKTYERCVRSGLFDFMAHPDLPKKFGVRPEGDLRRYYEPVIVALAETNTPFEINTSGLRKQAGEMYPSRQFVEMAFEAGVPVLINSDAHAPEEVGADFSQAVALAVSVGYTEVLRFEKRKRCFMPLGSGNF